MVTVAEQREAAAQGAKKLRFYWKYFLAIGAASSAMAIIPAPVPQNILWLQVTLLIFAGWCVWTSAKCHADAKQMALLAK